MNIDVLQNVVDNNTIESYIKIKDNKVVTLESELTLGSGGEIPTATQIKNIADSWNLDPSAVVIELILNNPGIRKFYNIEGNYNTTIYGSKNEEIEGNRLLSASKFEDLEKLFLEATNNAGVNIDTVTNYINNKKAKIKIVKKQLEDAERINKKYGKEIDNVQLSKFSQISTLWTKKATINADALELFDLLKLNSDDFFFAMVRVTNDNTNVDDASSSFYYKIASNAPIPPKIWESDIGDYDLMIKGYAPDTTDETRTILCKFPTKGASKSTIVYDFDNIGNIFNQILHKNVIEFGDASPKQIGVKGNIGIPGFKLNNTVLFDLLTNNKVISRKLYINEMNELITRKKLKYYYYELDPQTTISFTLSEKTITNLTEFRNLGSVIPFYTEYINIHIINAQNISDIDSMANFFRLMLVIYADEFSNISKKYKELGVNIPISTPKLKKLKTITSTSNVTDRKLNLLKQTDPILFGEGYAGTCQKSFHPTPISKSEYDNLPEEFRLKYPNDDDGNYYMCENPTYKYPGLKIERGTERLLPCCYKNSQYVNKRPLGKYLAGTLEKSTKILDAPSNLGIIVNKKPAGRGNYGLLPKNVWYVINGGKNAPTNIDGNSASDKYIPKYLRRGLGSGPNSFIEAVLLGLNGAQWLQQHDTDQLLQDYRRNLIGYQRSMCVVDNDTANLYQNNPNKLIDSEHFTSALEAKLNCSILVFYKNEKHINGNIELPFHKKEYLYKKLRTPLILIYKHTTDCKKIPYKYELIVKNDGNGRFTDVSMINRLNAYRDNVYKAYVGGSKIPASGVNAAANIKSLPLVQYIDSNGNARVFKYNSESRSTTTNIPLAPTKSTDFIYVYVSPVAPLYGVTCECIDNLNIMNLPTMDRVIDFLGKNSIEIRRQNVDRGRVYGIQIQGGFVEQLEIVYAYIPFYPENKLLSPNIETYTQPKFGYPDVNDELIDTSIKNKRIAYFLTELLLYLYADSADGNKGMDVDEFMREKTTMIPDYKYHVDNVDRKFTLNNDYFDGDGRLIIGGNGDVDAAQKLYDHLRYYLKYKIFKNHGIIARYKQLKYIPGYYGVSSDFDNYGGSQIVFMNTESLDYWKHVNKNGDRGFFARDYPLIWMDEPQFVRNWALNDGHPFVVQNVNDGDLELAVKTSKNGNGARKYVNFVYMNEGLMNFTREKSDDCVYVWAYSKENFGAIII